MALATLPLVLAARHVHGSAMTGGSAAAASFASFSLQNHIYVQYQGKAGGRALRGALEPLPVPVVLSGVVHTPGCATHPCASAASEAWTATSWLAK